MTSPAGDSSGESPALFETPVENDTSLDSSPNDAQRHAGSRVSRSLASTVSPSETAMVSPQPSSKRSLSSDEPPPPSKRRSLDPKTRHTNADDNDDGDDDDSTADIDSEDASQSPTATDEGSQLQHKAGVIKSIRLINFMCHENLLIELGPHINFIVGQNGSGKSAVLTALTTCLGGRAADTNRASSLKALIRQGQAKSSVRITFDNTGVHAYRQEEFGDEVVAEREFAATGASSYKLRSASGKVISSMKKDLTDLLISYNIAIDNPYAILTQDSARTFLTSSSPKNKFSYFMKAILVEYTNALMKVSGDNIERLSANIEEKSRNLERLTQKREELEEKHKRADTIVSSIERRALLYQMQLWLYADVSKSDLEALDAEILKREEEIQLAISNMNNFESSMKTYDDEIVAVGADIETSQSTLQSAASEAQAVADRVFQLQERINELKDNEKKTSERKNEVKRRLDEEEERLAAIETERSKGVESQQRELSEIELRLADIKEQLTEASDKIDQLQSGQRDMDGPIQSLSVPQRESEVAQCKQEIESLRSELRGFEREISELRAGRESMDMTYGRDMANAVRAIEQSRKFSKPPLGPLGRYISLQQPEWGPMLEFVLRFTVDTFMVESAADQDALLQILRQYNLSSNIHRGRVDLFDYSDSKARGPYKTILDVLDVPNEAIKRYLIDKHSIHRVVLINDREEADDYIYKSPVNTEYAFTLAKPTPRNPNPKHGYKVGGGQKGASSTAIAPASNKRPKMKSDRSSLILEIQSRQRAAAEALESKQRELQILLDSLKKLREELSLCKVRSADLRRSEHRLRARRDELQSQIEDITSASSTSEQNREAIAAMKTEIKSLDDVFATLRAKSNDLRDERRGLRKEQILADEKKAEAKSDFDSLTEKKKGIEERKLELARSQEKSRTRIAKLKSEKERVVLSRPDLVAVLDTRTENARNVAADHVPIEDGMTMESLKEEIEAVAAHIKAFDNQSDMTVAEIYTALGKAVEEENLARRELFKLQELYNSLVQPAEKRKRIYERICQEAIVDISQSFLANLSDRGFKGELKVDRKREELRMKIAPADAEVSANRAVETLSGGEKSFSQIALLVAIWRYTFSSLVALDEFDVFMDNANRKRSMYMVIDTLRKKAGTQSIIISPQDMVIDESVLAVGDIHIQRMKDPNRRAH